MLIITGAAGFIGSCLVKKFNEKGKKDIILVDDFSNPLKNKNLENKLFFEKIDRKNFFEWFTVHHSKVSFVVHIGARTDTTEFRKEIFDELNFGYSIKVWEACTSFNIPMVYASSAATYGLGEHGYEDKHEIIPDLKPLNPYGISKNEFDKWVLLQDETPPFWAGLKFFNVYGPNEYHKGRMASVIFHAFHQIRNNGMINLFRSHHPDFEDGKQLRDFVYVMDVVEVISFLVEKTAPNGIYNIGTGKARTFLDLANSTFHSLGLQPEIHFVDTPADIRDKYQYFTEARMDKLRLAGYSNPFYSLENGITDYVQNFLLYDRIY
jgi:ADP-L-glycero-D-manno-heptose 6-epimerase